MSPKVSFLVPVYNVAEYIEQCAKSIFEQTLDDIEIIFVDDCSTDDSIEIALRTLEDYPQRKNQVRVIRHEHNMGIAATRKELVQLSSGDYTMQVDSDDRIDPRTGELMYERAISTGADSVVCDIIIDKVSRTLYGKFDSEEREGNDTQKLMDDIINRRARAGMACLLVRRGLFFDNDIVWPQGNYAEDMLLSTQVALFAKRMDWVHEGLYFYRMNPKSVSHTPTVQHTLRNFNGYQSVMNDWIGIMRQHGMLEKYERGLRMNQIFCRNVLLPITDKLKYRRLFFKTYPEINRFYLFGDAENKPSYRERIFIAGVWLGLYPRFKRFFVSKHFRPRSEWSVYTPR